MVCFPVLHVKRLYDENIMFTNNIIISIYLMSIFFFCVQVKKFDLLRDSTEKKYKFIRFMQTALTTGTLYKPHFSCFTYKYNSL